MLKTLIKDWKFELRKRFYGFDVPDAPHFDEQSVGFFTEELKKSKDYLEYGSGGSTILAARLHKNGMSVEGDKHFLRDVQKKILAKRYESTMKLNYVDIGMTGAWGRPRNLEKTERRLGKWANYVNKPFEEQLDRFYDLILVDGRFRIACAPKVLQEGARYKADFTLLVDDYKKRKKYWVIEDFAERTEMVGRMAVFRISGGQMKNVPADKDVRKYTQVSG